MNKGDKISVNKDVYALSQKTGKSVAGKKGTIKNVLPKPEGKFALQVYVVKVGGELFTFCSSEITQS